MLQKKTTKKSKISTLAAVHHGLGLQGTAQVDEEFSTMRVKDLCNKMVAVAGNCLDVCTTVTLLNPSLLS